MPLMIIISRIQRIWSVICDLLRQNRDNYAVHFQVLGIPLE